MAPGVRQPTHLAIYEKLRERILFGDFQPGSSVTLQGVADEFGVSLTPVREAVRRLIAAGALQFHGNRRISLPAMSVPLLEEIYAVRAMLEPELARRAVEGATPADIERLAYLDDMLDHTIRDRDVHGYLRTNHEFHFAIYTLADSEVFLPMVDDLWLRFGPCLRVACAQFAPSGLTDQHKRAIEGLRRGDADLVAAAIAEDIEQGHHFVRNDITSGIRPAV